jgi:hypothetical protein
MVILAGAWLELPQRTFYWKPTSNLEPQTSEAARCREAA